MVNELERSFAKTFGMKYGIAVNSGTSALHTSLVACGVELNDEVISPALTVIMNTFATIYLGAIPIYADIDPETFTISPKDIEKKITPRTKAIQVVSTYGLSSDMDAIMEIAKKYKLYVIEDNAEAVLSYYKGKIVGSIGHMSCFSFESSKHINTGEGGMILTDDETLALRARKFAGLGYTTLTASEGRPKLKKELFQDPDFDRHDSIGFNYRMPVKIAELALSQLQGLGNRIKARQVSAECFLKAIEDCSWLIPQKIPEGYVSSYWAFAVRYEGKVSWKEFYNKYKEMGGEGFYAAWRVPYLEPVIRNSNYGKNYEVSCSVAESLQPKLMVFPTNYSEERANFMAFNLKRTIDYYGG